MSSNIFTTIVRARTVENINLRGVSRKQPEDLADFLRQKMLNDPDLTLRKIAERSDGGVTHSYLSKILSGAASNPSISKLRAIAKGLGVTYEEVAAATGGKSLTVAESFDGEFAVLFKGFHDLSPEDQTEMMAMVRMLATEVERRRPRKPAGGKGKNGRK